ncbi:MAG TPA: TIGR01777 family oxidoreductase [Planctomycetota bacterium]|nr:TIGR01777 family oxidoreductase [Planctomycetota bacterium]
MRVAVTGATGFVGRRFCRQARAVGHDIVTLSRSGRGDRDWDPLHEPAPLHDVDAVVHLAGEPLMGRWTRRKMNAIRDSRILGTRNIVNGLRHSPARVFVSASAVGYYGDRGEEILTESSPPGDDFLAEVCKAWEGEAFNAGVRAVALRTALVLGPGGAVAKMMPVFERGLGGTIGDGRPWMAWIHRDDLVDFYLRALEDENWSGAYLASAPEAVRSATFTSTLGRVLEKPSSLRVPRWSVRLAFGKSSSLLFASQNCRPLRALEANMSYRFPELEPALKDAVGALQASSVLT